jgi:transposase
MQSYSQDLRERVLWALERGERPSSIARRLEVSRVWVYQVREREQKSGMRTSFQIGHRRSRVAEMESVLRAWIDAEPDIASSELSERLAKPGASIKPGALWHQLNKWNLTFKKPCTPASKSARTFSRLGEHGLNRCHRWMLKSSCSLMKRGHRAA